MLLPKNERRGGGGGVELKCKEVWWSDNVQ